MISDTELNDLISLHKEAQIKHVVANIVIVALEELKLSRESELRPATRFVDCNLEDHIAKIQEEFFEVMYATWSMKKENLVEELVDLQMTCETALAGLGLDNQKRMEARRNVIQKNQERGYYIAKGN